MNNDFQLLQTIANFLAQGYLIEETLKLCQIIFPNQKINLIKNELQAGYSLEQAIIKCGFNKTFNEYFKFFCLKNDLAKAINQSLNIWKMKFDIIKKLKKELTYPLVLIIFLIFFSLFIIYGLLPTVFNLFKEFSIEPNLLTKIMFKLFNIIPMIILVTIIIIIGLAMISIYAIKQQYFTLIDFLINHSNIIKKLIQKYYSIKFALYYNELLVSGYDSTDIIIMLYQQIEDSDIKMIIYEMYRQLLQGIMLEKIVRDFVYFEPLFITFFTLMIHDNNSNKSLGNYLSISLELVHVKTIKVIKLVVPFVYCFTAGFVVLVYLSIIMPMMNVMSNL